MVLRKSFKQSSRMFQTDINTNNFLSLDIGFRRCISKIVFLFFFLNT